MNADKIIVVYHASCWDGLGAAWAMRNLFPNAHFEARQHGNQFCADDYRGATVYMVDFSLPRVQFEALCDAAKQVVLIDHHASAQDQLGDLERPNLTKFLDMSRSGAVMAWDYVQSYHDRGDRESCNVQAAPQILQFVQDRDLWRWELPGSREVAAWMRTQPQTFEFFDETALAIDATVAEWVRAGSHILQLIEQCSESMAKKAVPVRIAGQTVPAVNAPLFVSEIGHLLSKAEPFAATYFLPGDGRVVVSLRSQPNGADVSLIARQYGGGGHRNAASFRVSLRAWTRDFCICQEAD